MPVPSVDVVVVGPGDWREGLRRLRDQVHCPARILIETTPITAPSGLPDGAVMVPPGCGVASSTADYTALIGHSDFPGPTWLAGVAEVAAAEQGRTGPDVVRWGTLTLNGDGIVAAVDLPAPVSRTSGAPRPGQAVRRSAVGPDGRLRRGTPTVGIARLLMTRRPPGEDGAGQDIEPAGVVSVVLPVRNAAHTLGQQLAALRAQDYPGAWELIVVDNASTDRSMAVVDQMHSDWPELRHISAPDAHTAAAVRNAGVRAARGDRLLFCDADDIADPGWMSAMVAALNETPLVGGALDCGLLSSAFLDEQPTPLPEQGEPLSFARSANCAIRREVLNAVGGWAEFLRTGEDVELSWRAQLAGYELGYAPDAKMNYRLRSSLCGLARQKWAYGLTGALLYRTFRYAGYRRRPGREVLHSWAWMLRHLTDLGRPGRPRRRWIRYAARLAGFAAGSLRHRAAYF